MSRRSRERRGARAHGGRSRAVVMVLSGLAFLTAAPPGVAQPPSAERRGKVVWKALARDCAVPAGESAFGLGSEAISFLGSPDTALDLSIFAALEKQVWSNAPPDPATLDASQNARNLLRSSYLLLSLPAPGTSGQAVAAGGEATAREKVLATLAAIRRS